MFLFLFLFFFLLVVPGLFGARWPSLDAQSRATVLLGLVLGWLLLLRSPGFSPVGLQLLGREASVIEAQWVSCLEECGVLLGKGSNPCLLLWQADSKQWIIAKPHPGTLLKSGLYLWPYATGESEVPLLLLLLSRFSRVRLCATP